MDSCGRDPICRPSEPLFCRPKLPSPTMIAVATSHHNRNFTIRMGQPSGRLARNGFRVLEDFWPASWESALTHDSSCRGSEQNSPLGLPLSPSVYQRIGSSQQKFSPSSVQFKGEISDEFPRMRHQQRHLDFCTPCLLSRGPGVRVSPGAPPPFSFNDLCEK